MNNQHDQFLCAITCQHLINWNISRFSRALNRRGSVGCFTVKKRHGLSVESPRFSMGRSRLATGMPLPLDVPGRVILFLLEFREHVGHPRIQWLLIILPI